MFDLASYGAAVVAGLALRHYAPGVYEWAVAKVLAWVSKVGPRP